MKNEEKQIALALLPLPAAEFHILVALADRSRHGYGILLEIKERTGGAVRLSAGTLYAAIKRMDEQKLIVEREGPPEERHPGEKRRYYELTERGRFVARAEADRLEAVVEGARNKGLFARLRPRRGHA